MPEIDPDKTDTIVKLLEIPEGDRDGAWAMDFYNAVPEAALRVPEDNQVFNGPDGFPYLLLFIPPSGHEFHAVSIVKLLDLCLAQGAGVAIYPEDAGKPLWVFTNGNLLSYKLYQAFDKREPQGLPPVPRTPDRQVMVSQPNENYLPAVARQNIKRFLDAHGVKDPSLFMMHDVTMRPPQQLVFNVFREDFPTPDHFNQVMNRLTWYLPPHYGLVSLPNRGTQFDEAFKPL